MAPVASCSRNHTNKNQKGSPAQTSKVKRRHMPQPLFDARLTERALLYTTYQHVLTNILTPLPSSTLSAEDGDLRFFLRVSALDA